MYSSQCCTRLLVIPDLLIVDHIRSLLYRGSTMGEIWSLSRNMLSCSNQMVQALILCYVGAFFSTDMVCRDEI